MQSMNMQKFNEKYSYRMPSGHQFDFYKKRYSKYLTLPLWQNEVIGKTWDVWLSG